MDLTSWAPPRLDEEKLAETAPVVRAEILHRLETLWKALQPWIDGREDTDGIVARPDPRLVASALTCLKQLSNLTRLDQPRPGSDETKPVPAEILAKVVKELEALEARRSQV